MDKIAKWKWWLFGVIALGGLIALVQSWRVHREHSQDDVIRAAAAQYGLDPALIKAVIWKESWFNPNAAGTKDEVGLMQLRPDTAREWARAVGYTRLWHHSQMYDPAKNVLAGTWYLRKQLGRFPRADNPVPYALAAYNAGPGHALRWAQGAAATNSARFIERIEFPSTRQYVRDVLKRQQRYRGEFAARRR